MINLAARLSHEYLLPSGHLYIYRNTNADFNFLWKKNGTQKLNDIVEVVCSANFKKLSEGNESHFFNCHFPKITQLNDGSYKLYLIGKLLGGAPKNNIVEIMQNDPDISDRELSKKLLENLPADCYSSISVSSTKYTFGMERKDAKLFTFYIHDAAIKNVLLCIKHFFSGISKLHCCSQNELYGFLLGDTSEWTNAEIENIEKLLKKISLQERRIFLYLSTDMQDFACFPEKSHVKCNIL